MDSCPVYGRVLTSESLIVLMSMQEMSIGKNNCVPLNERRGGGGGVPLSSEVSFDRGFLYVLT